MVERGYPGHAEVLKALQIAADEIRGMGMAAARINLFGSLHEAYGAAEVAVRQLAKKIENGEEVKDCNGIKQSFAARTGDAAQSAWMPIETAPKDGTRILVCDVDRFPKNAYVVRWLKGTWQIGPMGEWSSFPTHWKLLGDGPAVSSAHQLTETPDDTPKPMCVFCGNRAFGSCESKAMAAGCDLPSVTSTDRAGDGA